LQVKLFRNFYFRNLLALALILVGYAFYLLPQFLSIVGTTGFCIFRSTTGIPCPGCGMGKATVSLSHGNIAEAFHMHPLSIPFALGAIAAIIWLIVDLIRKKESFLPLMTKRLKWPYFLALILVIAGVWAWNITKAF
jgi:glucan phosphoethanolaminetransferase (alkaline phosphatase superfamily)